MVNLFESNKQMLNHTLQKTIDLLNAESGSLFLFDGEKEELVLNTILDKKKSSLQGTRKRLGEGIAGNVATKRQAVLVKDINTDPRFNNGNGGNGNKNGYHYLTDSFICVPLFTSFGLIGVMNVTDKKSGESFSQKDLDLVCLITRLASLTMEHDNKFKAIESQFQNKFQLSKTGEEEKNQLETQEKFASIGRLAGNIVHEISGPLDGVMRYTNILLEKSEESDILREYLLEIKNGLSRMSSIMRSLMEFSGNSKLKIEDGFANINETIDQEISLASKRCFQPSIKIERFYQKDLPLIADYGLPRVFSNIINNAFDAMPKAGLLRVCTSSDEQNIKIIFTDAGNGMTEEVRANVFRPFFTTKPKDKGMGLGLSICQEIIRRYSGSIEIQSQVNQGTIVTVIIPKSKEILKKS